MTLVSLPRNASNPTSLHVHTGYIESASLPGQCVALRNNPPAPPAPPTPPAPPAPPAPREIAVSWVELGWDVDTRYEVRDLWAKKDLGVFSGSFSVKDLALHEARIYRFTPAAPTAAAPSSLLDVPTDLATTAIPIWAASRSAFVMVRSDFQVASSKALTAAVAFVTAQQSPLCVPDTRLATVDYGACIPHGGTSQPKLLGSYTLYVNGVLVGVGPGRRVNGTQGVDAIDVISVLRVGANAIGLQGYHTTAISSDTPRLLLQLVLTYADGSKARLSTGPHWGALAADHIFNPVGSTGAWAGRTGMPHEAIDMRNYPPGWSTSAFSTSSWGNASVAAPFVLPLGAKSALAARPIAVFSRRAASVKVLSPSGGLTPSPTDGLRYLVDFGRELQGGINISFVRGVAGQVLSVKLSEELLPDGSVKVPMRTGNDFADTWTLRDGAQTVMQHEYMEFRYAQIDVPAGFEPLMPENVRAWVIRYPLSDDAEDQYDDVPMLEPTALRPAAMLAAFSSTDTSLNSVWDLVRHTLVATTLDVNTDSNTRQRDLCHTDAFITAIGQLALSSEYGVSQMTAEDGFQLDSNIWQGMTDFRSALISLAYQQALYSGDLTLVRQRYEDMQKHCLVDFFRPELGMVSKPAGTMGAKVACPASWSPAGLPPGVFKDLQCTVSDLIDWPAGSRDGYVSVGNTVSSVANSYVALAAKRMARVASWLGKDADAMYYANVSDTILASLREKLYNRSSGTFSDGVGIEHSSMHATLFPAMAGAVDERAIPGMGMAVTKALRAKGMACSCMGAFWLLEGLYRMGWHTAEAADHALEVLTSNGTNSWLNMIAQGATATMEAWERDEKPNLSWSHPWCAGPTSVIVRLLLGVQPLDLGWGRMQFAPQPSTLAAVNATVPSPLGQVQVAIINGPTDFSATLMVPDGTTARVCLPPAPGVSPASAKMIVLDGVVANSVPDGRMLCLSVDVLPGTHTLRRR